MLCKFHASGRCNKGASCAYSHDLNADTQRLARWKPKNVPAIGQLSLEHSKAADPVQLDNQNTPCRYFMNGYCKRGNECQFLHVTFDVPQQHSGLEPKIDWNASLPVQASSDSRSQVPCKFHVRPEGCHRPACPFSHNNDEHVMGNDNGQEWENDGDENQDFRDDFTREFAGAYVRFEEDGGIFKISLPSDFSSACITGLQPDTTPSTVVEDLRSFGFDVSADCVRIAGRVPDLKAIVKVEDPLFAKELSDRMLSHKTVLRATPVHDSAKHTSYRKVYVSWHRATRSVWMNFGSDTIANRVAQKFNDGKYKIRGRQIKCSTGRKSTARGGHSSNPLAWTIILSNVPTRAEKQEIEAAIWVSWDKPRHIEMGPVSHAAAEAEVSVEVRKQLEQRGELESFQFTDSPTGRRAKATAWFFSEIDARSACSLNGKSLEILGKGKLTVNLVQAIKIKTPITILSAVMSKVEELIKAWREQHLTFRQFQDPTRKYAILKIEGEDPKLVAHAYKTVDGVLAGRLIANEEGTLWSPALERNGRTYQKIKMLEIESGVLIVRDKLKHQLRFYGPEGKLEQTTHRIVAIFAEENLESLKIELTPSQFGWAVHGGFKRIEHALGKNIAVLDVVSRRIMIEGTQQQFQTVTAIMEGQKVNPVVIDSADQQGDCPICLCEADNSIQTSCGHAYCLECLENSCRSAAEASSVKLEVKCQGDVGSCAKLFTLRELNDYLSTSTFEYMLGTFFEQYIQRHATTFRYCPTPDCGYIYRCAKENTLQALQTHVCSNCLEPICTSCHARHGVYTCAEYKDIASGGYAALAKLKAELNIKDCPECTTPMEKTEGCNHMTCPGCKKHICWVCLEIFDTSGPCYAHMNQAHGGIGLDHLAGPYE